MGRDGADGITSVICISIIHCYQYLFFYRRQSERWKEEDGIYDKVMFMDIIMVIKEEREDYNYKDSEHDNEDNPFVFS